MSQGGAGPRAVWRAGVARTGVFGLLVACLAASPAAAGANSALIFDASNSMNSPFDGGSRIEAAKTAIAEAIPGFSDRLDLGLVVFGHRQQQNCHDVEVKLRSASGNAARVPGAVQGVTAQGVSSVAQSLVAAANALNYREQAASIILLADSSGVENCRVDTCATIEQLRRESLDLVVHLIAVGTKDAELPYLQCISALTGGGFARVSTRAELTAAVSSALARAAQQEQQFAEVVVVPPPRPKPAASALADTAPPDEPEVGEASNEGGAAFAEGEFAAELAADQAQAIAEVDPTQRVSVFSPTRPGGESEAAGENGGPAADEAAGEIETAASDESAGDNVSSFAPTSEARQLAAVEEAPAADAMNEEPAADPPSITASVDEPAHARVAAIADGSDEFLVSLAPPAPPQSTILVKRREGDPSASHDDAGADAAAESDGSGQTGRIRLAALIIEDSKPVGTGMEWEVFAVGDNGAPTTAIARSAEAAPEIEVPAGDYLVKGKFGNATRTQRTAVAADETEELSLVLDAGGLQIDPVNAGSEEPESGVLNTIYAAGTTSSPIAENVPSGTVIYLNAGVYRIESRYGGANAVARADIEVQPGKLVRAKINHRAGPARLRLLPEAGGASLGGVTWQVVAGDGTTVAESAEDEPNIVLAEGSYEAVATHDGNTYRSTFAIKPGEETIVEINAL